MRRLSIPAGIVALLAAGFVTAPIAQGKPKQGGVVTKNGRVGPFQTGKTTAGYVKTRLGRPTSDRRYHPEFGSAYRVLRYRCGNRNSFFYFDGRGRLSNFQTRCGSWYTPAGTAVGDGYEEAADTEGREPEAPVCGDGMVITASSRRATLFVTFREEDSAVWVLAVAGDNNVLTC